MRKILIAVVISAVPAFAFAQQNNIGTCGWGAKLFDGQSGIAPQVLAVTTNGTSGNKDRLARDMSIGNGETLDSLAHLIGVREQDRAAFGRAMQANVSVIFPSGSTTDDSMIALRQVLRADSALSQYAASI